MEKSWFEFKEVRRRRLGDAVWIPLLVSECLLEDGEWGHVGYAKEHYGVGSVAIPRSRREQAKELRWSEVGGHDQGIWATKDYYKPAEVFQYNDKEDLGIDLVLRQTFATDDRNMFLRICMYRQRAVVVADAADAGDPVPVSERSEFENFEIRVAPMVEGGHFGEATYALFRVSRTDVDPDEDVPLPGPENNENTEGKSFYGKHRGRQLTYIEGELWRDEDIEPASNSVRVRGDRIPTGLDFIVDAAGTTMTSEELDNEDIGRWLWFRSEVIPTITGRRGGHFSWYTRDTGGVGLSGSRLTHFGINKLGQINIYAYDIARMPRWEQQVWAGFNIVPEGGVSAELLASQMRAEPACTTAPEKVLPQLMTSLDEAFTKAIGAPLFRPHAESAVIIARISRFRALTLGGLYALAKDLMRVIADQIDSVALQKVAVPPKGEKWGSLKTLEHYLATLIPADAAHKLMGPLAGAYDLRLADAHMPRAELDNALSLVCVSLNAPLLTQGFNLVAIVARVLKDIDKLVRDHVP